MERDGGWCLARATAFVILAAATAEALLVEAFDGFLAPPALGFRGREAVLAEMGLSMTVVLPLFQLQELLLNSIIAMRLLPRNYCSNYSLTSDTTHSLALWCVLIALLCTLCRGNQN